MKRILLILLILIPVFLTAQVYQVLPQRYEFKDSLKFTKNKNNAAGDSILSTDINGRMINILKPTGGGSTDTTSLSNRINLKVNISDTAAMLSPYINTAGWGLTKSSQALTVDTSAGKVATKTDVWLKWDKSGNAGTDSGTNFIGTTDYMPLMFRVNNTRFGVIDPTSSVGFGQNALAVNEGTNNNAFGYQAMLRNTTGLGNIAIGSNALRKNITGNYNVAVGFRALDSSTAGVQNVAIGYDALRVNTADLNTAVGTSTLTKNTSATGNTAIGSLALKNLTSGSDNTAVGASALSALTNTASFNTAVGSNALLSNTTGAGNAAFGTNALLVNTTGQKNAAFGAGTLENNIDGSFIVAIGEDNQYQATGGSYNTSIGYEGQNNRSTGFGNNGIGYRNGGRITTGSYNDFIGYGAGSTSASQKVDAVASVAIGKDSYTTLDSTIVLGADFIKGVGIGTVAPGYKFDVLSNTDYAGRFIGNAGGGFIIGARSSTFGGIWSNNVTPSSSNYTLASEGSSTVLNSTSTLDLAINSTSALHILSDSKIGIGTSVPDSLLTVELGLYGKRGVRFSGLPTGVAAYRLMMDANGTIYRSDSTTGSGGTNIYNSDGTIPTATTRTVEIAGTGNLIIHHTGNSNEIHIEGGSSPGTGDIEIDAQAGDLSLISPNSVRVQADSFKTVRSSNIIPIADSADWFMKVRDRVSGLEADAYWPGGGGSMVYPGAGIALSTGSAWSTSITDNSANWNTAYTDRLKWDGGATGLTASTGRTSLGGTTVGQNIFTLTNPGAITFLRMNADNTVDARSAANYKSDLSLNNVENTALSTWAGTANITTLGTIGTGTWQGSTINQAYLGSGGGGSSKFLREDNTWQTIAGGGDMVLASVQSVTGAKTFDKDKILMKGTSTGVTTYSTANTGASNYTFETPAANITAAQLTKLTTSTSANTASTIAERDANNLLALNNVTGTYATTATAAGTTTLTVASKQGQYFTGIATQTVVMPDATTLTVGMSYKIVNNSTGVVTVNKNGGTLIKALAANTELFLQVTDISTAAGIYSTSYSLDLAIGTGTATHIDFAAGTSSVSAFNLAPGTIKTTPVDGDFESNGEAWYGTTDAGNRGVIPLEHLIRADATRTFTSNTSQQAIFDNPTNGTLTLEAGTYFFEGLIAMTSMSATSGNGKFSLIGAGTATLGSILWQAYGNDNTAETTGAATGGSWHVIATETATNISTAATGTGLAFLVKGTFEVTGAGTIIPSFAQTTAAAAVVSIGSYFKCNRVGSTSSTSVGQWN